MNIGFEVMLPFMIGLQRKLARHRDASGISGRGMIGALLVGLLYQRIRQHWSAAVGEVTRAGIIGSPCCFYVRPLAFLVARYLELRSAGLWLGC